MCPSFINAFALLDATGHLQLGLPLGGSKTLALKQEFIKILQRMTTYDVLEHRWVSEPYMEPVETMKTHPTVGSESRSRGKEGTCHKVPRSGQTWTRV